MGLQQLDAVAEGIVHVAPFVPGQRRIFDCRMTTLPQTPADHVEVVDEEGRVCFARRPEVLLDAEMDSGRPRFEPASPTPPHVLRLLHSWHAEQALVEANGGIFTSGRHRELHMVKTHDRAPFPRHAGFVEKVGIGCSRVDHDASTSLGVASPLAKAAMFCAVTVAICSNALRVKKAW